MKDAEEMPPKHYTERMDEQQVLELFQTGRYELRDGQVYRNGKQITPRHNIEGYLYIRLYCSPAVINIGLHRVAWIVSHDRVIPNGCEIHHLDKDRENNHPSNLIAVLPFDHTKLHAEDDDDDEIPF